MRLLLFLGRSGARASPLSHRKGTTERRGQLRKRGAANICARLSSLNFLSQPECILLLKLIDSLLSLSLSLFRARKIETGSRLVLLSATAIVAPPTLANLECTAVARELSQPACPGIIWRTAAALTTHGAPYCRPTMGVIKACAGCRQGALQAGDYNVAIGSKGLHHGRWLAAVQDSSWCDTANSHSSTGAYVV